MSSESSVVFSPAVRAAEWSRSLFFNRKATIALFEAGIGFALIMGTVWTQRTTQRRLFWISAAYFLIWTATAAWKRVRGGQRLPLPSFKISAALVLSAILLSAGMVAVAGAVGTLHGLFGARDPLRHAGGYILWAVIQQIIQQTFFLPRFEQLTHRGLLATFIAAAMFAVAHIPNPVLVPITFLGGWILGELYRRYRSVMPLGIGHGLVGMAIAVSFPDHIQHHMRVGL
ncbi:MAG TPA: CPBP family intramembrane glutamic endopeptidase, partial [Terriglobales bacterium]